jgi:hypothetical protein
MVASVQPQDSPVPFKYVKWTISGHYSLMIIDGEFHERELLVWCSQAQNPQQVDSGSELEITAEESAIAAIPAPPEPDRTRTPGLIFPLGSPGGCSIAPKLRFYC